MASWDIIHIDANNNFDLDRLIVEEKGKKKIIIATDGSLVNGKSGCGVAFSMTKGISWRTRMNQNFFNAELQAAEVAMLVYENSNKKDN